MGKEPQGGGKAELRIQSYGESSEAAESRNYESTESRKESGVMINGDLRETRKQFFSEMEQKLQETYSKEEDRIFSKSPVPFA